MGCSSSHETRVHRLDEQYPFEGNNLLTERAITGRTNRTTSTIHAPQITLKVRHDVLDKSNRNLVVKQEQEQVKQVILEKSNKSIVAKKKQAKVNKEKQAEFRENLWKAVQTANKPDAFFTVLASATLHLVDFEELQWPTAPISIAYCHGHIWVAQGEVITAFTLDLRPMKFVELDSHGLNVRHDLMDEIQALAEVSTGQIAVACGSGLHLLNKRGRYTGRICEGSFTDVASCDGKLYASTFGVLTKAKVHVFDERNDWNELAVISLPIDGHVTLCVTKKKLIVSSSTNGAMYITDHQGHVLKKIGSKGHIGTLGHFQAPRVCNGSFAGSCLIADPSAHVLCVLSQTEELARVNLAQKVQNPGCAVVVRRTLYVLQTEEPYCIYKYE